VAAKPKPLAGVDYYPHPLFGQIPMIEMSVQQPDGSLRAFRDYDPDYEPPLPKGALRGNVRAQEFCRMCHTPRYFYVDDPRRCVQCGADFVFRAAEQKHWYESLKFHFDSVAVRCPVCRKKRRTDKALQRTLSDARARAAGAPSAGAQLALAEAVVRFFERTKQGQLADALAASRKARRLLAGHPARERAEADLWEGKTLLLLDSAKWDKARDFLTRFLEHSGGGKRFVTLRAEVTRLLATH
jgi:hypothetical protein